MESLDFIPLEKVEEYAQSCHDCKQDGPIGVFYRCNVCKVDMCYDCTGRHHPVEGHLCLSCNTHIDEGEMCIIHLACPYCLADTLLPLPNYPSCQSCPYPHLVTTEMFQCFKCKKEGCGYNIRLCGFVSEGVGCDKHICFDCGWGSVFTRILYFWSFPANWSRGNR